MNYKPKNKPNSKNELFTLSGFNRDLLLRVRFYAVTRGIYIYEAFEELVLAGLDAKRKEADNPLYKLLNTKKKVKPED